jgi:hypothetical protein
MEDVVMGPASSESCASGPEGPGAAGLRIVSVPHAAARQAVCDRVVRELAEAGVPTARITMSAELATRTLRRLADEATPQVGVAVTTLERWGLDRWGLYGDGRQPASGDERRAAVETALAQQNDPALAADLPGMAGCAERVLRAAAGSPSFEDADARDARLSPAEGALARACRDVCDLLERRGLIEPGRALAALARDPGRAGWTHLVLDGIYDLGDAELALVARAAAERGVTLVAELGEHPACEAARALADRLTAACTARGVPVMREQAGADVAAPWSSSELAELAGCLFRAGEQDVPRVAPRGDVRFCLPAGRYAEPELVARTLQQIVAEGCTPRAVAVACAQPLRLAEAVAGRLAETPGRSVAVHTSGRVPLAQTDLGRLLAALATLVDAAGSGAEPALAAVGSDAARNPLSGVGPDAALELDRGWRGRRATTADDVLRDLCAAASRAGAAPTCDEGALIVVRAPLADPRRASASGAAADVALVRAVDALRAGDLARAAAELVAPLDRTAPDSQRERAAAARLARRAQARDRLAEPGAPSVGAEPDTPAAKDAGAPGSSIPLSTVLARLMADASVPVAWTSVPARDIAAQRQAAVLASDPNAVEFCTLEQLAGRSFEAVLVCDLTAADASVGDRADAARALLDRLGVGAGPTALQTLRRQLAQALQCARSTLVLERCLRDPEARDLRPSALFEEVVDCYRDDPSSPDDLDRATGLPKDGRLFCLTLGEERFAELASPATWTPARVAAPAAGLALRPDVARRAFLCDDQVWSPAALELYLSCPMRWFYEKRIPAERVDAAFGPRELGGFSRRVLRGFHEELDRRGVGRIEGAADRELWQPVLDACFDQVLEVQRGENPLVAVTRLEQERLETVRRDLRACAERDASLPGGFACRHHDFALGEREPVKFGRVRLRGLVDRVDEDERGRMLVIGYRGAIGEDYGMPHAKKGQVADGEEPDRLPRRCQVLIAAAALQRERPGRAAVGALYVSYNRARVMGFFDATCGASPGPLLPEGDLVGRTETGENGFQDLLGYVEGEVADAMDRLRDGDTSANPRFGASSCAYCTVTGCPKRRTA